jgi:predicted glycoside hydrolase/deacetylase ChbG (UPF0249 family)
MNTSQNQCEASISPPDPLKGIVLCADDFGMSAVIDAGIIDLASEGRLSATSCMSRGSAFRRDIHLLTGLQIDKGLHLNLTEALDERGFFQPLPTLIRNCFTRRIDPIVIEREIDHQLDAFEQVASQTPDYVDGHQHVHQFPIVRDCLIKIMRRRYASPLPWVRATRSPRRSRISASLRLKAFVIECLGAHALQQLADGCAIATNRHLLGVYDFSGGEKRYVELLDEWVRLATPQDLIMCHPARGPDEGDVLNAQRCAEHAILSGSEVSRVLALHHARVALNASSIRGV